MGNQDESGQARTPGAGPRVTALPGPSRLVRITEGAFDRVRALALGDARAWLRGCAYREQMPSS